MKILRTIGLPLLLVGVICKQDIVKAHKGEFKVETSEVRLDDLIGPGERTTFIIQLPC